MLAFALFAASLHLLMWRAAWCRSATPPTSAWAPTAPRVLMKLAGLPMPAAFLAAPVVAGAGRLRVRLLLRAAHQHLLRHADARLRPDRLRGRAPVGRGHRRRQRPAQRLAAPAGWPRRAATTTGRSPPASSGLLAAPAASTASPFGLTLRAVRDHARRAEAVGVNIRALSGPRSWWPASSRASAAPSSRSSRAACSRSTPSRPCRCSRW